MALLIPSTPMADCTPTFSVCDKVRFRQVAVNRGPAGCDDSVSALIKMGHRRSERKRVGRLTDSQPTSRLPSG